MATCRVPADTHSSRDVSSLVCAGASSWMSVERRTKRLGLRGFGPLAWSLLLRPQCRKSGVLVSSRSSTSWPPHVHKFPCLSNTSHHALASTSRVPVASQRCEEHRVGPRWAHGLALAVAARCRRCAPQAGMGRDVGREGGLQGVAVPRPPALSWGAPAPPDPPLGSCRPLDPAMFFGAPP